MNDRKNETLREIDEIDNDRIRRWLRKTYPKHLEPVLREEWFEVRDRYLEDQEITSEGFILLRRCADISRNTHAILGYKNNYDVSDRLDAFYNPMKPY